PGGPLRGARAMGVVGSGPSSGSERKNDGAVVGLGVTPGLAACPGGSRNAGVRAEATAAVNIVTSASRRVRLGDDWTVCLSSSTSDVSTWTVIPLVTPSNE